MFKGQDMGLAIADIVDKPDVSDNYIDHINKQHFTFSSIALILSEEAKCNKRKVGCVIVKDKHIISSGVNGTIAGNDNSCEDNVIICVNCEKDIPVDNFKKNNNYYINSCSCGTILTFDEFKLKEYTVMRTRDTVLHAEENTIINSSRLGISLVDTTVYVTTAPCIRCARMLVSVGVKEVVYIEDYKNNGLDLLKHNNVKVIKIGEE